MAVMIASAVTPRPPCTGDIWRKPRASASSVDSPRAIPNLRLGPLAAGSRRSLLRQEPRREQRHGAAGCALLLAFLPGDARDVEMRPVVLARELGKKARGGDAAAGAVGDIGEVGEVAIEPLVVILP